jgi:hypothetical protein
MTTLDSLKAINAYPVPLRVFHELAVRRGLPLLDEATQDTLLSKAYSLAKADVLMWLAYAPNISQGGQSYSFSEEQRTQLRNEAYKLYAAFDESETITKPIYGYKGTRL